MMELCINEAYVGTRKCIKLIMGSNLAYWSKCGALFGWVISLSETIV